MQHASGEVAVVGEQEHPACLEVEATDGEHAKGELLDVVSDRWTSLRIAEGGDDASGFVEADIDRVFGDDPFAVDFDAILLGIGASSQLRDDATVDTDTTGGDELFGGSP